MLAVRAVTGVIFLVHGIPKLKDDRPGWKALGLGECLAGVLLIAGFFVKYAALLGIVVMAGALYHKIFKWKTPFTTQTTGWEFDLLILAVGLMLFFFALPY